MPLLTSFAANILSNAMYRRGQRFDAGEFDAGEFDAGEFVYTTPGTYSFVVPSGVTSVSAVAIGGGGGAVRIIWGAGREFPSTNVALADSNENVSIV